MIQTFDPPPFIIPIFISHQGCPHRCVFCNQEHITGQAGAELSGTEVAAEIARHLAWPRRSDEVQVAFYGGSFTCLPRARQEELLAAVQPYRQQGLVQTLRLSTRPDAIDPEIVSFLLAQGVGIVELGVQSLNPEVLARSGRGYSPAQVERAFGVLRQAEMVMGGQLMLGLPGETTASTLTGARRLAELGPDFVRIYPALVVKDSGLAVLYRKGEYRPLSLARAVYLSGRVKDIFERAGIGVVRMGLQPAAALERSLLARPYHPAFGELVLGRTMLRQARRLLSIRRPPGPQWLSISAADQSIFRGQKGNHLRRLHALGLLEGVELRFDPLQPRRTLYLTARK